MGCGFWIRIIDTPICLALTDVFGLGFWLGVAKRLDGHLHGVPS